MPALAEIGGTGQETGEDGPASGPAAEAATAAGCPAKKHNYVSTYSTNKLGLKVISVAQKTQFIS